MELLRSREGFPAATKLGAMGAKDKMSRAGQVENVRDHGRVQPGRAVHSEDKQGAVLRVRRGGGGGGFDNMPRKPVVGRVD